MVTILYLPLTLATVILSSTQAQTLTDRLQSIYSMNVLPKNAGLVSYILVTIIMCAITYVLVFNLQPLKGALASMRSNIRTMFHTKDVRRFKEKDDAKINARNANQGRTMA